MITTIVISAIMFFELLGILGIVINWKKDCKELGKENLAVSLKERIFAYVVWLIFPSIISIIVGILKSI